MVYLPSGPNQWHMKNVQVVNANSTTLQVAQPGSKSCVVSIAAMQGGNLCCPPPYFHHSLIDFACYTHGQLLVDDRFTQSLEGSPPRLPSMFVGGPTCRITEPSFGSCLKSSMSACGQSREFSKYTAASSPSPSASFSFSFFFWCLTAVIVALRLPVDLLPPLVVASGIVAVAVAVDVAVVGFELFALEVDGVSSTGRSVWPSSTTVDITHPVSLFSWPCSWSRLPGLVLDLRLRVELPPSSVSVSPNIFNCL